MRILDSRLLARLKFMGVFAVSYLDKKGNEKAWEMVSRNHDPKCISGALSAPDAAIIVPYHRKLEKLVVIREFRVPIGTHQYGFPAGLCDPGEDLATSTRRELFEETGLNLVNIYRHSPAIFSSAGITDESIAMVYVEVDGTPDGAHLQDSEDITVYLMDRDAVAALLDRSDVAFGARAWIVMDAFARGGAEYLTGGKRYGRSHFNRG